MATIVVIGGGASGMTAAIASAKNNENARIVLIEHSDRVGKKILVTGNGKCNLTNRNMNVSFYRSENIQFIEEALALFGNKETVNFFESMGLLLKEKNGYMYPFSEQAATVNDFLRTEIARCGIEVLLNTSVNKILAKDNCFKLFFDDNKMLIADKLILATGSKAAPKTGSDGSGYVHASRMGHNIIKPLPALVQLICKGNFWKGISGVRIDASVSLVIDREFFCKERGELQITEYGISGIPVFQVSRYAVRALDAGKKTEADIDFLPSLSEEELFEFIKQQIVYEKNNARQMKVRFHEKTIEECLNGLLNKKITIFILKASNLPFMKPISEISDLELKYIINFIKSFKATITGSKSFDMAQVCSGGVDTLQIDANTMQSKIIKGLYFAGELLDVDGICGGYNLQWAWTSGYIAGESAARSIMQEEDNI